MAWRLLDADSGNILFCCDINNWLGGQQQRKYFVRFRIQVFRQGEDTPLLDETLNLTDRDVLISFPTGTLGDLLGWFLMPNGFSPASVVPAGVHNGAGHH